jgi:Protein tyrosine and serine/threonine kinase
VVALEPSEPTRGARRRLRLAVAARAAIDHPNLVRAWPVGEGDGRLFVVFERCPHPTLGELLEDSPLGPTECSRLLDGAAAGVDALSRRGLVARGLTPERVFVHPEHGCVLLDLGIPPDLLRRVPAEHDPELAFRSPEELERNPVDLRSTVYSLGADRSAERLQRPLTSPVLRAPHRNGRPSMTGLPTREVLPVNGQRPRRPRSREVSRSPGNGETRPGVAAPLPGAVRRCEAMVSALLALAGAVVLRAHEALRWCARSLGPIASAVASLAAEARRRGVNLARALCRGARRLALVAVRRAAEMVAVLLLLAQNAGRRGYSALRRSARAAAPKARGGGSAAASTARRGAEVAWPLFLRACRLVLAAARRGVVASAGAGRRAHRALLRTRRSAPAVLAGVSRPKRRRGNPNPPVPTMGITQLSATRRRFFLPAVGAIVASALSGIALAYAFEPKAGPSSVSRSGLTVQLPRGWEPAAADSVLPTLSPTIAAAPSGETGAGFVAVRLSSLAAAEEMLGEVQTARQGRTHVQLDGLDAWQYAGLRPRPHVVATGYLIPTTGGAVLGMCHASTDDAPVRLAECKRAATTLVVRGERPRPLPSADRSNERVTRVIAVLRASRAGGRRRLKAAELGRGQARAASSLKRSYERAARTLDRISALENGYALENLSAAVRNAGVAYSRLAHAASIGNRSAYAEATHAVVREEDVLRRELARTGDA